MDELVKFAKEHGYETAEYLGVYKNNKVYEAIFKEGGGGHYCVGLPAFILESEDGLEWIQDQRSFFYTQRVLLISEEGLYGKRRLSCYCLSNTSLFI